MGFKHVVGVGLTLSRKKLKGDSNLGCLKEIRNGGR